MRAKGNMRYVKAIPIVAAILVGGFLAVASAALDWSPASTLVVAIALVAMLGLFGTPLLLVDFDALVSQSRSQRRLSDLEDLLAGHSIEGTIAAPFDAFKEPLERQRIAPAELGLWYRHPQLGPNQPRPSASQLALTWGEPMSSNRPPGQEPVLVYMPKQTVFAANLKPGELIHRPQAEIEPAVG